MTLEDRAMIALKIQRALDDIDQAWKQHDPIMLVAMFSGGNDSLAACYVASFHPAFSGVLHINTGIGVRQTREFVRQTCAGRGWKLWEYKAVENRRSDGTPNPMIYEDLILRHGFPGPGGHQFMYNRLKERPLRCFERDMGANGRGKHKKRIMLISGTRIDESKRRKMNVQTTAIQQIEPRRIFVSPIREWSKADCRMAREYGGLEENQVSKDIHKSGECLCGAFAEPGELEELRFFYPDAAAEIDRIAARAEAAGKHAKWGCRPPGRSCPKLQLKSQPLCVSCNAQQYLDL